MSYWSGVVVGVVAGALLRGHHERVVAQRAALHGRWLEWQKQGGAMPDGRVDLGYGLVYSPGEPLFTVRVDGGLLPLPFYVHEPAVFMGRRAPHK